MTQQGACGFFLFLSINGRWDGARLTNIWSLRYNGGLDTVSTQVIRSLELCRVQYPVGLAWRRLVSKHDLVTLTEDKLCDRRSKLRIHS
jgi:hypothetical protein